MPSQLTVDTETSILIICPPPPYPPPPHSTHARHFCSASNINPKSVLVPIRQFAGCAYCWKSYNRCPGKQKQPLQAPSRPLASASPPSAPLSISDIVPSISGTSYSDLQAIRPTHPPTRTPHTSPPPSQTPSPPYSSRPPSTPIPSTYPPSTYHSTHSPRAPHFPPTSPDHTPRPTPSHPALPCH